MTGLPLVAPLASGGATRVRGDCLVNRHGTLRSWAAHASARAKGCPVFARRSHDGFRAYRLEAAAPWVRSLRPLLQMPCRRATRVRARL